MPDSSSSGGPLYSLYEQYVGEPHSKTGVYGYWVFIAGYLLGSAGIVAFLVEMSDGAFTQLLLREAAFVLAALALPLALFGVVLMLPVRRWGVYAAALGTAVANGDLVGRSLEAYPTRERARKAMRTVKDLGPDARVAVAGATE